MIAGGHSLSEKANSGKLSGCLPNKHTRAMINFADGAAIYFNDMRTFGYLELVDRRGLDKAYSNFGPDPLNSKIDAEILRKIFKNRQAPVKALLLNQKLIAGIGNIYADEILYQAGVRPDRRAKTLKPDEIKKISIAIKTIIARAVKHRGTTFNDYVDSEGRQGNFSRLLKVYGRQGKACPRCPGETVHKKKIAGRGTHYCPKCQK
jgi:formamidopyrimidine-DNA glycosylase